MGGTEGRSGSAAVDVLRRVHAHPSITRAELARDLGLGSGTATEVAARLRQAELIDETPAPPTGSRGRPTTCLGSHPSGPLVLAAEIEHDGWALSIVELGGTVVRTQRGSHRSHRPDAVLRALNTRIREARSIDPERLRAVAISFAGAVQDDRLAQVHNLGWRDVDVRPTLSEATEELPLVLGNDATLGGLAEARRGAATESTTLLHLRVQAGIGGVVVDRGRPFLGSSGAAGEFGHLPFGDPARRCPCGARGCWSNEVDGGALARILGRRAPQGQLRLRFPGADVRKGGGRRGAACCPAGGFRVRLRHRWTGERTRPGRHHGRRARRRLPRGGWAPGAERVRTPGSWPSTAPTRRPSSRLGSAPTDRWSARPRQRSTRSSPSRVSKAGTPPAGDVRRRTVRRRSSGTRMRLPSERGLP